MIFPKTYKCVALLNDIFPNTVSQCPSLVIFFVYWYLVVDFIPCVSFAGEDPLHEGLWWHPLNWQHGPAALPVIAGSGKRRKKGRVHLG